MLDEPTAANSVLNVANGVIVDIGGGTTGLSVLENGKVTYVADEATGGTHLTLVLAGNYNISFEEAEALKKQQEKQGEILSVVNGNLSPEKLTFYPAEIPSAFRRLPAPSGL